MLKAKISPRRLMSIANASLAALVALSLLLLARDTVSLFFTGTSVDGGTAEDLVKQPARKGRKALLDYAPVVKDNVFGFPAGELTPISSRRAPVEAAVPETVNITLVGVVAWPGGFGYAIVEGGQSGQEVFKTGEHIPGTGRLVRVESYRVFIESGGREVEVPLKEFAEPGTGSPAASKAAVPRPEKGNGFARRTAENEFVVDQKAIEESLENPKNVLTDARLLPRMVDGEQEGFIMREVRPGGLYETIGLRNGDVLLSVNDFKLSNPQTALQAFTALKGMDRIKLDILRNNEKMTLTYNIR